MVGPSGQPYPLRRSTPLSPSPDALTLLVLAGAGVVAGGINAVAGGGSLVSFPALLLAGYPAVTANVTNSVALLPGYAGGSASYRRELVGQGKRVRRLGTVSALGAVVGAFLLVKGPEGTFQRLAPWLILSGCALLVAQPAVARTLTSRGSARRHRKSDGSDHPALLVCQLFGAVYGGYFGAGLGVVMLALLGIFVADGLQRLNALKGLLSLLINVVAVAAFLVVGHIAWEPVLVMWPASFVGGVIGVVGARRLDERVLRYAVVAFGSAIAVRLLV